MSHRQHPKDDYQLDEYTFGDSKAETTLARLLNEKRNPSVMRKVGKLLAGIGTHLRNIRFEREELGTRSVVYRAMRKFYLEEVDKIFVGQDREVISFVKNATVKRMTTFLKNEYQERPKKVHKNNLDAKCFKCGDPAIRRCGTREGSVFCDVPECSQHTHFLHH